MATGLFETIRLVSRVKEAADSSEGRRSSLGSLNGARVSPTRIAALLVSKTWNEEPLYLQTLRAPSGSITVLRGFWNPAT